ncbi:MAG TPA: alpha/beta fold hydrolase [Ktedonobacteraceae bacterium]|nr:alpha/beta fold hydrolase [Ktedonobacteraceae bacterium]
MQERLVQLNNVMFWTISEGKGLPVMLCNGGPGYCDYLGPVAEMMKDLVQVYRWEQRGCGRSAAVPPYDHVTCLSDLEALRRYFGHERWIIGGHSWGANLALDYATRYPHRVPGLIYLAGTGITEDWRPAFEQARRERTERLPVFAYPFNEEAYREGQRSRVAYLKDSHLIERIRSLEMPAVIIQGENDLRPNWSSEQVAHLLPHAQYAVIPDAEHCLWLTHPRELRKLLRDFLKKMLLSSLRHRSAAGPPSYD